MLFDLKRVFFINNFVILGVVPAGENMLLSFISLQGHRLGVQCLACRHFHRTDASFLMGLSLVFPHEGQLLQATILPSYLILKGYFSLILIMLVFFALQSLRLDLTHSLRETLKSYCNESDNKTRKSFFTLFFLKASVPSNFFLFQF